MNKDKYYLVLEHLYQFKGDGIFHKCDKIEGIGTRFIADPSFRQVISELYDKKYIRVKGATGINTIPPKGVKGGYIPFQARITMDGISYFEERRSQLAPTENPAINQSKIASTKIVSSVGATLSATIIIFIAIGILFEWIESTERVKTILGIVTPLFVLSVGILSYGKKQ